ncbi:MAG: HAD family hydrolase [Planctomycetes bacterium]|nr:HAD family hydrolase [Planctomycetota bacterium]
MGGVTALCAVLFDLDGVLVDSYEAWFEVVNDLSRDLGCAPVSRERFAAIWGQGTAADVEAIYHGRTVAEVDEGYRRMFRKHAVKVRVNPQAAGVFAALRARGVRIAVITNTDSPIAREVLAAAGLSPDALVGGRDVPHGKPAPDMVLRACGLLGVTAQDALVVGDTRYDREAARAARVRFAGLGIEGDDTLRSLEDVLTIAL